ncbi:MAG: nitronate monooxygenase [Planctomycetes bacterium]|nr:nitronate monooxygenase [Planctomycetota bacterium]
MNTKSITTPITKLCGIRYPILQGGMIWVSGSRLTAAVSNAGGLGVLGSGSMRPDALREEIQKTRSLTSNPFGVNIPISFKYTEEHIKTVCEQRIPVVITSAGSPKKYTETLHNAGCKVFHVVPTAMLARKCEDAGVNAVIAEGTEAGGHNGYEEITTMVLIPSVRDAVKIPVIAAGGIMDGRTMAAAFALGADAVQIGTRFAASEESDAHPSYKQAIIDAKEGDSLLLLKKLGPTRMIRTPFALKIKDKEDAGAGKEELVALLGEHKAREGASLGNIQEGILEAGQVISRINKIQSAGDIVAEIMNEFAIVCGKMHNI